MARFRCARWEPLPESGTQAKIRPTQVIFHTAVDAPGPTNLGGYFARADVTLESHFWVPLNGQVVQLMDTEERADANRFANRRQDGSGAISIETEDEGDPVGVPWTAAQLDALVAIGREAARTHGIPVRVCRSPSDPGFGWHSMWGAPSAWTPVAGKTCPGPTRIGQISGVLARIAEDDEMTPEQEARILKAIADRSGLIVNTVNARTGMIYNAVKAIDSGADEVEVARLVLAGIGDAVLSDEQVRSIIDAMPQAVKQALREGAG